MTNTKFLIKYFLNEYRNLSISHISEYLFTKINYFVTSYTKEIAVIFYKVVQNFIKKGFDRRRLKPGAKFNL